MDRKGLFKGAATGLAFAGAGNLSVRFLGFNKTSLVLMLYLYVLLGTVPWLKSQLSGLRSPIERLVVVTGEEEMVLRKILTGEKYRVKGKVEKL